MSAYGDLMLLLGDLSYSVRAPTEYRAYAPYGWHLHDGAASGTPFADGKSLEKACENLLALIQKPGTMLVEGICDQTCFNRYNTSSARKVADRAFVRHVKKTAREVRSWPAWKRGLPPCEEEECEREYDHEGKHRKTVESKKEW